VESSGRASSSSPAHPDDPGTDERLVGAVVHVVYGVEGGRLSWIAQAIH